MPVDRREKWKLKMIGLKRCPIHGKPLATKRDGRRAAGCSLCLVQDREKKRKKLGLKRRFKKCLSYILPK